MASPERFSRSFVTLWSVAFLGYLSFQLLTASLPLYAVGLGANDVALGLLSGVIALTSLLARPWVGWWLDHGGARWGMATAGAFYALSAVGFLVLRSVSAIVGLRIFTGLAIALSATTAQVLTIALAPEHRRGEALSLASLANSLCQGIGPPSGIAIAGRVGYPGLFAVCALLGTLSGGICSHPPDRRFSSSVAR